MFIATSTTMTLRCSEGRNVLEGLLVTFSSAPPNSAGFGGRTEPINISPLRGNQLTQCVRPDHDFEKFPKKQEVVGLLPDFFAKSQTNPTVLT
jgi:hypothetical protein